jgi:preprotein translocase subunit SecA
MNEQREIIYDERKKVLSGDEMKGVILGMIRDIIERVVNTHSNGLDELDEWDINGLRESLSKMIPIHSFDMSEEERDDMTRLAFIEYLYERALELYAEKELEFGEMERIREAERVILLKVIDQKWMDHIDNMDQMRQGVGLRAYAQRDPLVEYKFMGYDMFDDMTISIQETTVRALYGYPTAKKIERERVAKNISTNRGQDNSVKAPVVRKERKVGRNEPCPCGSGKKYKQCCGR